MSDPRIASVDVTRIVGETATEGDDAVVVTTDAPQPGGDLAEILTAARDERYTRACPVQSPCRGSTDPSRRPGDQRRAVLKRQLIHSAERISAENV